VDEKKDGFLWSLVWGRLIAEGEGRRESEEGEGMEE
jgi:hypothetical protein